MLRGSAVFWRCASHFWIHSSLSAKGPGSPGPLLCCRNTAYFSWLEMNSNFVLRVAPIPYADTMITTEIPAAIRPYSMAVAPDSSFTKRAIRFFIGLNSMYTWLVELTSGLTGVLGTATVGATLRSDNCGAVNSIAQKRRNRLFLRTVNVELMHCLKCNIAGSTLSWRRRARATFGF